MAHTFFLFWVLFLALENAMIACQLDIKEFGSLGKLFYLKQVTLFNSQEFYSGSVSLSTSMRVHRS